MAETYATSLGHRMTERSSPDSLTGDKPYQLGVLFVHGIGEQPRGDTLLRFGDPCIVWLDRWLEKHTKKLSVEHVETDDHVPTGIQIGCGDHSGKILFRESWWAGKFTVPAISDLSWWLLLVGTAATLSHSVKPVKLKWRIWPYPLIPFLRATFFYAPVALSYQLLVVVVSLLGAVPFTPWRDSIAKVLLGISQTLGDSYVLLHSPTLRQVAIASVVADLKAMRAVCEQTLVIAHSQGAAIAYCALQRLPRSNDPVEFISVGSGLEKLAELNDLNAALDFRHKPDQAASKPDQAASSKRVWYLLPAVFILFWLPIVIAFPLKWPFSSVVLVEGMLCAIMAIIAANLRVKPTLSPTECAWYDIFASSDPVSNGPTRIDSVEPTPIPIPIVNERSLLQDHTTYFSNSIDFIPRLVKRMREFGQIDWIDDVNESILHQENQTGITSRRFRKGWARVSKWFNFGGFVAFQVYAHDGLWGVLESINGTVSWIGKRVLGIEERASLATVDAAYWLWGALLFVFVELVLRWCNRTSERTYTNLFFNDDSLLRWLGKALFRFMVLFPVIAWAGLWFYFR